MTTHVLPARTDPARLAPLAKLPLLLDLHGKRVVVAGDGGAAAWKAERLAAAGARVAVYAPDPQPELLAVTNGSGSAVTVVQRSWRDSDLDHTWLAIADAADEGAAARFAAAARSRGALVHVIGRPALCDFQFGLDRWPVASGMSADGIAATLGQAVRRRIGAILPASPGVSGKAARTFRRFWKTLAGVAFISQAQEDEQLAAIERLARETLAQKTLSGKSRRSTIGEVVIVGGGPGDPALLTLGAVQELQAADVILYDRLVTPGVLELARPQARRIHVGKEGHGAACRQQDISSLLVDLALEGKRVVRLKGGDPAIFGRTGEEVEACRAADVPVRIVPGVTTASAAAASLGLSLTHRDHAQRVQFVTGHDRHGGLPADIDLDALADPRATTAVYMGRRTASLLAKSLMKRGLDPTTAAIVISNVSRPDEGRKRTTLAGLAEDAALGDDRAPTLILIGTALSGADGVRDGSTSRRRGTASTGRLVEDRTDDLRIPA